MDYTIEVLNSLQAQNDQAENEIANLINPSWILNPLRRVAYTDLGEQHKARVRKVIFSTASINDMHPFVFNQKFEAYLNMGPPPPLQVPENGIISGAGHELSQVIFGGPQGIQSVPFAMSGWPNLTLTRMPRGNLPATFAGDGHQAVTFRSNCRLLANVMVLLNIYGQRFISARFLLNTFKSGCSFGVLGRDLSENVLGFLGRVHSVSRDALWGSYLQQGVGGVVIMKWRATNGVNGAPEEFLQVAWE